MFDPDTEEAFLDSTLDFALKPDVEEALLNSLLGFAFKDYISVCQSANTLIPESSTNNLKEDISHSLHIGTINT